MEIPTPSSQIDPVKLVPESRFKFACHKGLSCFTQCCRGIDIILTPYDILRMKKRLGLTADEFLHAHTDVEILEKTMLPVVRLKMREEDGSPCPFVTAEGCRVYEDRPATCRYYPVGMVFLKKQDVPDKEEFYFMVREDHCKGFAESREWTVAEWRADQGLDLYDERNRGWMEIILRKKSLGPTAELSPKALQLFFMVSSNVESFRRFVFESRFLSAYDVPAERIEKMRNDDLELLEFGFEWLRGVLYGDRGVNLKPEAEADRDRRNDASAETRDS